MNPGLLAKSLSALKGGGKFAAAVLTGDIAPQIVVDRRRAICRGCPSCRVATADGAVEASNWCGEPLVDGLDQWPPTCGCLIYGKTIVGSEKCPQARW